MLPVPESNPSWPAVPVAELQGAGVIVVPPENGLVPVKRQRARADGGQASRTADAS